MKGYIYIITNDINDKVYIGKTYTSIELRWKRHIQDAFRKDRENNQKFYNALREYGKEHFQIKELAEFEEGELEQKEIEYIEFYDSYFNGYNSTLGGEGYSKISLNEDEIIQMFNSGYSLNQIAREFGTKTTRTISSIIKKNGLDVSRQTTCIVEQYDLKGNYIQSFQSKKEAWKWLLHNYKSDMKRATAYFYIKKSSETGGIAFGYKWKQYETDSIIEGKVNGNDFEWRCNAYDSYGNMVINNLLVMDVARKIAATSDKELNIHTVRQNIIDNNMNILHGYRWEVYKVRK